MLNTCIISYRMQMKLHVVVCCKRLLFSQCMEFYKLQKSHAQMTRQLQLISCKCAVKVILDTLWQDKTGNENITLILTQTRTIHSRAARRIWPMSLHTGPYHSWLHRNTAKNCKHSRQHWPRHQLQRHMLRSTADLAARTTAASRQI